MITGTWTTSWWNPSGTTCPTASRSSTGSTGPAGARGPLGPWGAGVLADAGSAGAPASPGSFDAVSLGSTWLSYRLRLRAASTVGGAARRRVYARDHERPGRTGGGEDRTSGQPDHRSARDARRDEPGRDPPADPLLHRGHHGERATDVRARQGRAPSARGPHRDGRAADER